MKIIATYGSLKKGFWNHERFNLEEPIATSTIQGQMFVNPALGYPHLYENEVDTGHENKREYEVELYEIEDKVFETIDAMEQASGYLPKECAFKRDDGLITQATLWFADPEYRKPNPEHYVKEFKLP